MFVIYQAKLIDGNIHPNFYVVEQDIF